MYAVVKKWWKERHIGALAGAECEHLYMCDARQIKMHSAPRLFSIRGAAADEKKIIMHAAADWNLG
jgi:hypothetical protein